MNIRTKSKFDVHWKIFRHRTDDTLAIQTRKRTHICADGYFFSSIREKNIRKLDTIKLTSVNFGRKRVKHKNLNSQSLL